MHAQIRIWSLASASFLLHDVLVKVQAVDELLSAPAPASDAASAQPEFLVVDNTPFLVQTPDHCLGEQKEYLQCNEKPCDTCQPENCEFADWGDWAYAGECTGLMKRVRVVKTYGNTCGSVCNGDLAQTKSGTDYSLYQQHCIPQQTNASLADWGEWSVCGQDKQRSRTRTANAPSNGGSALNLQGPLEELEPCGQNLPTNCMLSEWVSWTACTKTCNGGRTSRQRHVVQPATFGGSPCNDTLWENKMCQTQPCVESRDCMLGDWGPWFGCNVGQPLERHRERKIISPATGNGARCAAGSGPASDGTLRQLQGCPQSSEPVECKMAEWNDWQTCDRTCAGGQTYRLRHVVTSSRNCGSCPAADLKEVKACNSEVPCEQPVAGADCVLADWAQWSECSAKCGKGLITRERKVTQLAKPSGKGCSDSTKELKTCEVQTIEECGKQDCVWGEWDSWSGCSQTCGGGTRHRARVISQSPRNGGALCIPGDKSEVQPCSTQQCDTGCQQGLWGAWSDWFQCSATCDQGYMSRHRDVTQYPDDCGEPATGPSEQVAICTLNTPCHPPVDCTLSEWHTWSDCTNACKGIRERSRHIEQYASGGGKTCHELSLKEIVPCNPGPGEAAPAGCGLTTVDSPCVFTEWSEWAKCDVTCGRGQTTRTRSRRRQASGNGAQCEGATSELGTCGAGPCDTDCVDCVWDDWAEWDDCSHCGGQKRRSRGIRTMPNHCGKPCVAAEAQEVTNCTSTCEKNRWCAWAGWQQLNPCDANQCGATRTKQRSLITHSTEPAGGFLFKAEGIITCSGSEVNLERCPSPVSCNSTCIPVKCEWGIWSEWTKPSCEGLCERHRVILKANNECGEPCEGPMVSSKRCDADCRTKQDCELSEWHLWSTCRSTDEGEQRYRLRSVTKYPRNGGLGCTGELSQTRPCSREQVNCQLSDWSAWLPCTKTCGGGYHIRHRQVNVHARNGGAPCTEDKLHELMPCAEKCCVVDKVDCVMADWSEWGDCESSTGQMYRHRDVRSLAQNGGVDCGEVSQGPGQPNLQVNTSLVETQPCAATVPVDCVLTEWAKWSECTATCGGGQVQWHRMISMPPANGGASCPQDWVKIEPCNTQPCSVDTLCAVGDWMQWSSCSSTCGEGIRERERGIKTQASGNGKPCTDALKEVDACTGAGGEAECAEAQCTWSDWQAWTSCTHTCNGGTMKRDRSPSGPVGSKPCVVDNEAQIVPCNTAPCDAVNCKDATWGEWTAWTECSASCDGGIKKRSREQSGKANSCGKPLTGTASEIMSCNMEISCEPSKDCTLTDWTPWSVCTQYLGFACAGYKERTREMEVATGTGKPCSSGQALQELADCTKPMPDGSDCPSIDDKVDCIIADWSDWSGCSESCGRGHHMRKKTVQVEPQNGGKMCEGSMMEMKECLVEDCTSSAVTKDCEWSPWSDWSGCAKCGTERRRTRTVAIWPENGGKGCEGPGEEIDACNVTCRYEEGDWCMYGDWNPWGSCSASCGPGTKSRARQLKSTSFENAQAMGATQLWAHEGFRAKFDSMLNERTRSMEARHNQELALAFGSGLFLVFFVFGVIRICGRTALRREGYDSLTTGRPESYSSSREPLNNVVDEEGWSGVNI